jgi:hypothetical protein
MRGTTREAGMRIYTVTCDGVAAAVVRADNPTDAVGIARELAEPIGLRGAFAVREPDDSEMISWLENRTNHLLPTVFPLATAS